MSATKSKAVFLSYASQDAEVVARLAEALRAAGVEVWFDRNELVGGDAWDAKIRGQIKACALFVPVISANTQARLEGYFRLEWKLAAQRMHTMAAAKAFLLPVAIDGTKDADAHVPEEFREVQWTRLPEGGAGSKALEQFCARVRRLLEGEAKQQPPRAVQPEETASRGAGSAGAREARSRPWVVPAVLGLAVIVALALWLPRRDDGKSAAGPGTAVVVPASGKAAAPTEARRLAEQALALVEDLNASRENHLLADDLGKRALGLDNADAEIWAIAALISTDMLTEVYDFTPERWSAARMQAARALRLDPANVRGAVAEARIHRLVFEMAEGEAPRDEVLTAVRKVRAVLARAPTDRFALRELALAERFAGNEAGVQEALRRLAALPAHDPKALVKEIRELRVLGRLDESQRLIDTLMAGPPVRLAHYEQLLIFARGWADLERARAALPRVPAGYLNEDAFASLIAQVWLWSGEPEKALQALQNVPREYLEEFAANEPRSYLRGWAHALAGRAAAAQREWQNALTLVESRLAVSRDNFGLLEMKVALQALLGDREAARTTLRLRAELGGTSRPLRITDDVRLRALVGETAAAADLLVAKWPELPVVVRNWEFGPLNFGPEGAELRRDARVRRLLEEHRAALGGSGGRAAAPAGATGGKSVAVLAFKNLSGDPAREFFSDGLSEAVTEVLGRVPGLKVVGSASAFSFKGKAVPIPEIARQLGVTHLVEGTVLQEGSTVRVTAKLIQADGFQVGVPEKVDRELRNIFALHDEVAALIARQLSLKLGASSTAAKETVDPEAFELYVQARQAWGMRTTAGFAQAEILLKKALTIEPDFARAHAALADVWTTAAGATAAVGPFRLRGSPVIQQSAVAAQRAIQLDPQLAEAHAALGNVYWNDWRIGEAETALRLAVTLNANYASAHQWLGRVLATQGRMDEAVAALRRAHDLEPLAHKIADNLGLILFSAGRYSEALALAERAQALQPNSFQAAGIRAWALSELGRADAAVAAVRVVVGEPPTTSKNHFAYALARAGARREAQAMLDRIAPAERSASGAAASLVLGQLEACWSALEEGSQSLLATEVLLFWPVFDPIRTESRFRRMLSDLGLTEAHARAQAWRAANPPEKVEAKR